jgi:catalase
LHVITGIGLSPDRLLQGRLLIYDDSQHHRLGSNFKKLPVNQPKGIDYPVNSMRTMGAMNTDTRNHYPNYLDSDYGGPKPVSSAAYLPPPMRVDGHVSCHPLPHEGSDADYYQQPRFFWNILSGEQQTHLCRNLAISFEKIAAKSILDKMMFHLEKIDRNLSEGVKGIMQGRMKGQNFTDSERIALNIAQELLHTK